MRVRMIGTALLIGALAAVGISGDETPKTKEAVSIKGEVIDLRCYSGRGAKGTEHASCATACIKRGVPAGLLTETGKVIILISGGGGSAEALATLVDGKVGIPVTVRGQLSDEHGVDTMIVESIEKQ